MALDNGSTAEYQQFRRKFVNLSVLGPNAAKQADQFPAHARAVWSAIHTLFLKDYGLWLALYLYHAFPERPSKKPGRVKLAEKILKVFLLNANEQPPDRAREELAG